MERVLLRHRALLVVPVLAMGCSLFGLSEYDLATCAGASDPCARLCSDGRCTSCTTYQCNEVTSRCELGTIDRDRDGDPPTACGGTDCDDMDPKRAGILPEVCDGIDNNCNQLVDEGLIRPLDATRLDFSSPLSTPSIVRDDGSSTTLVSSVVTDLVLGGPPCVAIASDVAPGGWNACATFPVAPIAPAQPYSRVAGATFPPLIVTAYIRNDGCEGIALRSTAGGAVEPNCSDGAASLPSFISVNGNVTLLLAHYAAPVAAACDAVRPAPLMLRLVDNANTPAPVVTIPYALTPASASVRPAAFVALLGAVLIAAPDEATGLGLWVFDPSTLPGLLTPRKLDTGVTLVGARSLDVAVGTLSDAGQAPIAIVAESGCPPRQGVWVAAGTLTHNMSHIPTSVQLQRPVQIATGGTSDASPSVAWVSLPYDEWRVTWVVDGHTYFQRFTPEGMAIQGPIEVGGTISAAVAAYGSHDDVLEATSPAVDGNVYSVKLGCPK